MLADARRELLDQFRGLTAFTRSPAEGVCVSKDAPKHDDVVAAEVMADQIDHAWWADWRRRAEAVLR